MILLYSLVGGVRMSWTQVRNIVIWTVLISLSAYYLYRGLLYRFITPDQLGPTLFHKQLWYFSHVLFALPVLVGGPLQFSKKLRATRPEIHRLLGKIYVFGAVVAALTAIYLGGYVGEYEGSKLPIVLLALLWLFFTLGAWRSAVHRQFDVHRVFMIRSYGLALVLVWLRLMGDVPPDVMFFYIEDQAVRDTTLEWMSWVIPLIAMEIYLSWWPMLRRRKSHNSSTATRATFQQAE